MKHMFRVLPLHTLEDWRRCSHRHSHDRGGPIRVHPTAVRHKLGSVLTSSEVLPCRWVTSFRGNAHSLKTMSAASVTSPARGGIGSVRSTFLLIYLSPLAAEGSRLQLFRSTAYQHK